MSGNSGQDLLTISSRPVLGPTQPYSLGIMWTKRDSNHSLTYSSEINNSWSFTFNLLAFNISFATSRIVISPWLDFPSLVY